MGGGHLRRRARRGGWRRPPRSGGRDGGGRVWRRLPRARASSGRILAGRAQDLQGGAGLGLGDDGDFGPGLGVEQREEVGGEFERGLQGRADELVVAGGLERGGGLAAQGADAGPTFAEGRVAPGSGHVDEALRSTLPSSDGKRASQASSAVKQRTGASQVVRRGASGRARCGGAAAGAAGASQ